MSREDFLEEMVEFMLDLDPGELQQMHPEDYKYHMETARRADRFSRLGSRDEKE